jgi:putative endonuclease
MNTSSKNTGNLGEELAATWLLNNNYSILHRNWRFKHTEVDIIATKQKKLHFVEVKTRTNAKFGLPEESISQTKMNALKKAAAAFIEEYPEWKYLQFDVIAITLKGNEVEELFVIEDVFF